jgi:hypothetical protein
MLLGGCTAGPAAGGNEQMRDEELQTQEYWDARYRDEDSFDWFKDYAQLKGWIEMYIPRSSRILHVGCGNSVIECL